MKKHIPNFLTILRILLAPLFIYLVFGKNQILGATIVFILASITDFFDGLLARRFNVITNFGKLMDPLADKILVVSALFALSVKPIDFISLAVFIIIVSREIAVTVLRNYYAKKNIFIAANIWGKLKTTLQMIGIIGAFLYKSVFDMVEISSTLNTRIVVSIQLFFWLVAIVTILSGLNYFFVKNKTEQS
jgi:CDP-diacylglycerol--glycerol-3-phosphate 3-phosphatidyltransferase